MKRSLPYAPSLDGVRALCLLAVIVYHAGLSWGVGGYLGVSTFFTLSGFLITGLLVAEAESDARVRFGQFWKRRLQRLLPASLLTLAAIAASARLWVSPAQQLRLGDDLLAALAYAINWRFVEEDYAYALLFVEPSEVQHFWSLAIEGQFYLFFPVVIAAVYWGRARPRLLAVVLLAAAALSLGGSAWLFDTSGQERVYFGTDTRLAEFLLGGLLALGLRATPPLGARAVRLLDGIGVAALLVIGSAWTVVELDTPFLYRGGLGLYALASALLLAGCVAGGGWLRALLSGAALRYVGRISYGAYLYHWPLLLWLAPLQLEPAMRLLLVLPVTLLLAGLSHRFLEEPVRRARRGSFIRVVAFSAVAYAAVALLVVLSFSEVRGELLRALRRTLGPPVPTQLADARTISIFGDSTAIHLGTGFGVWMRDRPDLVRGLGITRMGCGLLRAFRLEQLGKGVAPETPKRGPRSCALFFQDARRSIAASKPDISVVLFGPWDVELLVSSEGQPTLPGRLSVEDTLREAIRAFVDVLSAEAGHVVWLEVPPTSERRPTEFTFRQRARGRERFNQLLREHAARHPDRLSLIDLPEYLSRLEASAAPPLPDGAHFPREAAIDLVARWLGPRTLEVVPAGPHSP